MSTDVRPASVRVTITQPDGREQVVYEGAITPLFVGSDQVESVQGGRGQVLIGITAMGGSVVDVDSATPPYRAVMTASQ